MVPNKVIILNKVQALKDLYANMSPNEKKLKTADFLGHYVIPTIACLFIACYWILGLMKYNSPDWSEYHFLLPEFKV